MSALLVISLSTLALANPADLGELDDGGSQYFDDLLLHWERNDGPQSIVNGETTSDYPATVSLSADGYGGMQSFCSGTLINKRWVLTAAHCLLGVESSIGPLSSLRVVFGDSINDTERVIDWDSYEIHPGYSDGVFRDDIGLVKLSEPVDDIDPMVVNDEEVDDGWIDTQLTFVGFGVTNENGSDAGTKRTTDLAIVDFDDQFIFTLENGTDTCYGDSGGPGYEVTPEGLEVAGIVSYGEGPCAGGGRTGNTNAAVFIDWISEFVTPITEPPTPDLGGAGLGLGVARDLSDSPFTNDRAGTGAQLGCSTTPGAPTGWLMLVALVIMRTGSRRDS